MRAALVADSGPAVGLGHRRRLGALATALDAIGVDTELLTPEDRVADHAPDLVVVDSYRVRADAPGRFEAPVLAAVDDLTRDLAVDVVIDPSPGADATAHTRARVVLAGATYALVDPALAAVPGPAAAPTVTRVFVTLGASDAARTVGDLAARLAARLPEVAVRVASGPWRHTEAAPGVTVVDAPAGLADELAAADLVVCAGGVTMLEAAVLGRPVVAVLLAENQRRAVEALAAAGAVVASDLDRAADAAAALAADPDARATLSANARRTVDGHGAARTAAALVREAGR